MSDDVYVLDRLSKRDLVVPRRGNVVRSACLYIEEAAQECFDLAKDLEANHYQIARMLLNIGNMLSAYSWERWASEYPGDWPDDVPMKFSKLHKRSSFSYDLHDFNAYEYGLEQSADTKRWEYYRGWLKDYALPVASSRFKEMPRSYPIICQTRRGYVRQVAMYVENSLFREWGFSDTPSCYCRFNADIEEGPMLPADVRYMRYVEETGEEHPKLLIELRTADAIERHIPEVLQMPSVSIWEAAAGADESTDTTSKFNFDACAGAIVPPDGKAIECSFGRHEAEAIRYCQKHNIDSGGDPLTYLIQNEKWFCLHRPSPAASWILEYPNSWDTGFGKPTKKQCDAIWGLIEELAIDTSKLEGVSILLD